MRAIPFCMGTIPFFIGVISSVTGAVPLFMRVIPLYRGMIPAHRPFNGRQQKLQAGRAREERLCSDDSLIALAGQDDA